MTNPFDAWPPPLRWALFLPIGIISMLIANRLLDSILDAIGMPRISGDVIRAALFALPFGFTLTFVSAMVSPRPWPVGVVMFALVLVISVAPAVSMMTVPYQRTRLPSLVGAFTAIFIAHASGGALGLYLIRSLLPFGNARSATIRTEE
jgi:hypothetical protein